MAVDMRKGNPTKVLILFSIPLVLSNIVSGLNFFVNSIIVGKFVGVRELGAIGATQGANFLIQSLVIGLSVGSSVVIGQYFGANNTNKLKKSITSSFILITLVAIVMCLLGTSFVRNILEVLNTPSEIIELSAVYLRTIFIGIIPFAMIIGGSAILRSLGDSFTPLIISALSVLLDVILTYIFVAILQQGVFGAAFATVISQILGAIFLIIYAWYKLPIVRIKLNEFRIDRHISGQIIKQAGPAALQYSILGFGNNIIQSLINGFGYNVVAAYSSAMAVCNLAYSPAMAIGNASSTFAAQNRGANDIERIKKGLFSALKIIGIISVVITGIIQLFSTNILGLFIDSQSRDILLISVQYLKIMSSFLIVIGILYVFRETLRGIGDSFTPMLMGILDISMRVIAAMVLAKGLGYYGIWWSQAISWSIALSVGILVYFKGNWQNKHALD